MSAQTFQLKGMQEEGLHKLLQSFSRLLSLPAAQLPHHPAQCEIIWIQNILYNQILQIFHGENQHNRECTHPTMEFLTLKRVAII